MSEAELVLRPATPADAPRLTELVQAAYGHYVERIGGPPRPMLDDYADVVRRHPVTVAERGGEVVGLVVLELGDEGFVVDNVAVDPAHKGSGVGRALLQHAEAEALRAGSDSIALYTHERMTENLALYARIGYVEYDRRSIGDAFLVYLRKPLPPAEAPMSRRRGGGLNLDSTRGDVMDDEQRTRLERLQPFEGDWRVEAPAFPLPPELADAARITFEWALGGAFLLQRSSIPVPEAPEGLSVIGTDAGDGYTQHYFDSRGIARVYAMTFDGRDWTLERRAPDFTPLPFHQRWLGGFTDHDTIEGRWEASPDGQEWELDFELAYHRVTQRNS